MIPVGGPSSGTYTFAPAASDIVLLAFARCGLRRSQLQSEHFMDAGLECNLLMGDITNRSPNRWTMETQSIPLLAGIPAYPLPNRTIAIAIAYITTLDAAGATNDRTLSPISGVDYGAVPNKGQQGFPSSYWFNLLPSPTITLWEVPDQSGLYTLNMQTFRQNQDVDLANGQTLDIVYRFLDAFATGLAARLAEIYAPAKADRLYSLYEKRFDLAAQQDQEDTPLYIMPGLSGYSGM